MAPHPVSPLAPAGLPALPAIAGVRFAAGCTGMRYKGRDDLMLAVLPPGATVAAVTTSNTMCSAPVLWCRKQARHGRIHLEDWLEMDLEGNPILVADHCLA